MSEVGRRNYPAYTAGGQDIIGYWGRLEEEHNDIEPLALMGQLTSVVAHEIRNSLNASMLFVDYLEAELDQETPDTLGSLLPTTKELKAELTRLHNVVEDCLSLARLVHLHREREALGTFVADLGREQQEQLAKHRVILCMQGLETLGRVFMHPNTMRRALLNLMQNAVEAMPHGGTLTLFGQQTASRVELEIRDTGCGIPEGQLPMMFTPFHTTKPGGTGLGLYVVQQIITAHEGEVTVRSTPGAGTTFGIRLPRAGGGV